MDIWGPLISALVGQLISLVTTGLGGEGGNRHLARTRDRGRSPRRSYLEIRVTWRRGGGRAGRTTW